MAEETSSRQQDQIAKQARAEYEAGLKYRHDREKTWQIIEDFYFNKSKKNLKGKFNVPVPIMPGFVEAWLADMAKHATISFEPQEQADYKACKKVTALYVAFKNRDDYDWDMVDTDGKKLACLTGRSMFENYGQGSPEFRYTHKPIDHYDFIADPIGGGNLENHRFVGIDNVFLSREDLKEGAQKGLYDARQVEKLINATAQDVLVDNDNVYKSKQNRFIALGMDGFTHNYAGQQLYKFIKMGTTFGGRRQYVLLNYETGLWVRCQPLKEVFESGLWWPTSWATHRDTFNFWSKGPCDDMIPIAETMRVLINQELDNRNKRNYGQRAYDPEVFPEPAELEWRQDGLVKLKAGTWRMNGDMSKALFNFETPELQGSIDLASYLDGLWKEKTGVNSEAQGQADTSKVGIAYLNVQQSAKRRTLVYESYVKCQQANGRRFLWACFEHIRKPQAVKIIGEQGEEWDDVARREIKTDWNIRVEGGPDDVEKDEIKKKQLRELLDTFTDDELAVTSPKWRAKTKLQSAGIDEDEVRMAFDLEGDHNKETLSEASQLIQDCLAGKPYALNLDADTAFVQKILDYAKQTFPFYPTEELAKLPPSEQEKYRNDTAQYMKLMKLADLHAPIAAENMARKAVQQRAQAGLPPTPAAEPGMPMSEEMATMPPAGQEARQLTPTADYGPTR